MQVKNLDVAACVIVATGQDATLRDDLEHGLTGFVFPDGPEVAEAVALYYTGHMMLPARQLLRVRADLYRRLKQRGGKR